MNFRHVLINGLSIGTGGGFTVGSQLTLNFARHVPESKFTLSLCKTHKLHEEILLIDLPPNLSIHWAPSETVAWRSRLAYEKNVLSEWCKTAGVDRVVQLNGQMLKNSPVPVFAHHQDPWPYRPEAWSGIKHRMIAALKRHATKDALKHAAAMGWTSNYLRDVVTGWLKITPRRSETLYNGLPLHQLLAAREPVRPFSEREPILLSVSNVDEYKRQRLVIQAMPALISRHETRDTVYHIVGSVSPQYKLKLQSLSRDLGVEKNVVIHGRQSDAMIDDLFRKARAFTLMSVCESFGIPAIESMALGTPVVVADCCAIPEVCGDAGVLSPMDDLPALVNNLHRTLSDQTLWNSMAIKGKQRALLYQWPGIAARLASILDEL